MSLKLSCFKTIVKSDLKRLWWTSALVTLFAVLLVAAPLLEYMEHYVTYSSAARGEEYLFSRVFDDLSVCIVFGIGLAGFLGLSLFTYMNSANSVSFFHGLPVKRSTVMLSHYVSAVILIVIPVLVNSAVCLAALNDGMRISWLLKSIGVYLLYSLVILTLTVFISMLSGNTVAGGIFTVIFALLPLFITAFLSSLCELYLYGYSSSDSAFEWLLENIYLAPQSLLTPKAFIYICMIAVFGAMSFFVYNKRHLENYGEVIAFTNLRGLFKVLFGFCSGVLGFFYCWGFWNIESALVMFVFAPVGVIVAHMLSNKSFSLKGVLKPIGATLVCVLVTFSVFKFDLTGFESRIPDLDEVVSVSDSRMDVYNTDIVYYEGNSIKATRKEPLTTEFTAEDDIQNFRALHSHMIETRNQSKNVATDYSWRNNITFTYTLKNGRKLSRTYSLTGEEVKQFIKPIHESDVYRSWKYPVVDGTEKRYDTIWVYDERSGLFEEDSIAVYTGSSNEAKLIVEALKKDRENITFERMLAKDYNSLTTIEVEYSVPMIGVDGSTYYNTFCDNYDIDAGDVNTIKVLTDLGLLTDERLLGVDDIKYISVGIGEVIKNDFSYYPNDYAEKHYYEEKAVVDKTIQLADDYETTYTERYFAEKQDIQELYDFILNYVPEYPIGEEVYARFHFVIHYNNSTNASTTFTMTFDALPELLSYFQSFKDYDDRLYYFD